MATVQVVSNYVWRVGSTANKWTQSQIAGWTRTDGSGTSGNYESYGLNKATAGSPYLPANWTYRNAYASELANGGSSWHALSHGYQHYSMPQVVSVAPKDPNFAYFLHSWSDTKIKPQYAGHYIVLFGWTGSGMEPEARRSSTTTARSGRVGPLTPIPHTTCGR